MCLFLLDLCKYHNKCIKSSHSGYDQHNVLMFLSFPPFLFTHSLLFRPACILSKSLLSYFLHHSHPLRLFFKPFLHLLRPVHPSRLSQARSRSTAGGRTVRRNLPGVMSWCDTTTCTRGTSPSSSWPSESSVSPYHTFKCQNLGYICLYFLSLANPNLVTPLCTYKPACTGASGVLILI